MALWTSRNQSSSKWEDIAWRACQRANVKKYVCSGFASAQVGVQYDHLVVVAHLWLLHGAHTCYFIDITSNGQSLQILWKCEHLYFDPCLEIVTSVDQYLWLLQSKKITNDQELIQSVPISCPQNQKENNWIHKLAAAWKARMNSSFPDRWSFSYLNLTKICHSHNRWTNV